MPRGLCVRFVPSELVSRCLFFSFDDNWMRSRFTLKKTVSLQCIVWTPAPWKFEIFRFYYNVRAGVPSTVGSRSCITCGKILEKQSNRRVHKFLEPMQFYSKSHCSKRFSVRSCRRTLPKTLCRYVPMNATTDHREKSFSSDRKKSLVRQSLAGIDGIVVVWKVVHLRKWDAAIVLCSKCLKKIDVAIKQQIMLRATIPLVRVGYLYCNVPRFQRAVNGQSDESNSFVQHGNFHFIFYS